MVLVVDVQHLRLAELSKGCVQAGYLVKLSSVGNIWKRRYFVLKDTQLLYFNSSSVRRPHATTSTRSLHFNLRLLPIVLNYSRCSRKRNWWRGSTCVRAASSTWRTT